MVLHRFAALSLALATLGSAVPGAFAADISEQALSEIYTKGFVQGRPIFTEHYDVLPSAYFPGLPAMKLSSYDHSSCKPILPEHAKSIAITPPAGFQPTKFDCSKPKRRIASLPYGVYRYVPLYQLINLRRIMVLDPNGQTRTVEIVPSGLAGQHPYELRSDVTTPLYNPWYNRSERSLERYLQDVQ